MERRPGGEDTGADHPGRPPCDEDRPGRPFVGPARAGRAGSILFLGQPHRSLTPFDADIGDRHPPQWSGPWPRTWPVLSVPKVTVSIARNARSSTSPVLGSSPVG